MGFWAGLLRYILLPIVVLVVVLTTVPIWIWLERRIAARIQQRIGPNRVGPQGLLQPMADAAKLLFKEDIIPLHVDPIIYLMAPVIALIPSMAALAVIPFSPQLMVADINIGVLWVLGLSSLAVYGVVLAGWASNNKWSLMGGIRSAAQMVSYELGMGLAVLAVVVNSSAYVNYTGDVGSPLSLHTAVVSQSGLSILGWNCIWQFPAFVIFLICAAAESNRGPFDLPEAEQELVAGFHTEYSSFRFAMFFMGEYVHLTILCSVCTALFLGGWLSPFANIPVLSWLTAANIPLLNKLTLGGLPVLVYVAPVFWFFLKVTAMVLFSMWARWTLPRLRWDQLMRLGWVVLVPAGLVWLATTATVTCVGTALCRTWLSPLWIERVLVAALAVGAWYKWAPRRQAA